MPLKIRFNNFPKLLILIQKNNLKILVGLMLGIGMIAISSCHPQLYKTKDIASRYKPFFNPAVALSNVYHSNDSTILRISVNPKFEYRNNIVKIQALIETNNRLDTLPIIQHGIDEMDIQLPINKSFNQNLTIAIQLSDRSIFQLFSLRRIDELASKRDVNIFDFRAGNILYGDFLKTGNEYQFKTITNGIIEPTQILYYQGKTPLPKAPIFKTDTSLYGLDHNNFILKKMKNPFIFQDKGLYKISFENINKELLVYVGDNGYPSLDDPKELAESMRYITKNKEYDTIVNARNIVKAIDNFWMDKAGSFERGKVLFKEYFDRVQWANQYCTEDKPGWMTDKGMIFIIYGLPDEIGIDGLLETWYYTSEQAGTSTKFVFNYYKGHAILSRGESYLDIWNFMIHNWRSGIIRNPRKSYTIATP